MYFVSKGLQLSGLVIIGIGFMSNFPQLMDYKLLGFGSVVFLMGWIVQKFGLSNQ